MSVPAILDIESLLAPIPGDLPAGEPLADTTRMLLDELRKEPDPLDPSTAGRRADWPQIIRITSDVLENKTKDLLVGVRLLEALVKREGAVGLRDGLKLIFRLVTDCHDRLHPIPEPGETLEVWEGSMKWINDATRGGQFPATIGRIPLFTSTQGTYSREDWLRPDKKSEMEEAIPGIRADALRAIYGTLQESMEALNQMARALDEKMGSDVAPDFLSEETSGNIGNAIRELISLVEEVASRRGVSLKDDPNAGETSSDSSDSSTTGGGSSSGGGGPVGIANNREGLYRQIEQIAGSLSRIEPHSPVPILLMRCVRLGSLPFPQLIREFIRDSNMLDELDRTLGVTRSE